MSEVKRYFSEKSDLEVCWDSKPSADDLVLYSDFDRVTAERDDLQQRLTAANERAAVINERYLREHGYE